ncbi:uncharacterized protein J8A68_000313 [[Candida] subhashii]|uniref:Uncharacterized protein n=1 Tax=[Candida] subhashii TaxID=561895 RepID=A0A8J5V2D2_9ASCO|nr:uncharacterized protein J8A68_000313 [[Candida] subhashii]KAG7666155.1 hypothetical protein J8A68_000313 [[Candida] subhashii]
MTQQNDTVYDLIKGFTHSSTAPTSSDSLNNSITTRKNITGTFQLDDSFPIRICRLFILTLTEDNNMIGLEAKERSIVANLLNFSIGIYVPKGIDILLTGLGDIRTKDVNIKVRWPWTTFRTALVNANLYGRMAMDTNHKGNIGHYETNLVWNDEEGHQKLEHYIENYWKDKVAKTLPDDEGYSLTDCFAAYEWVKEQLEEMPVLLGLYTGRIPFDDPNVEPVFQTLGLKRMTISDEVLVKGLLDPLRAIENTYSCLYDQLFSMRYLAPLGNRRIDQALAPLGNGSLGQVFKAGKDKNHAYMARILSTYMTDDEIAYGFSLVPSISFKMNYEEDYDGKLHFAGKSSISFLEFKIYGPVRLLKHKG